MVSSRRPALIPCCERSDRTFCDFLDELGTEGGQIIRIAAGNKAVVDHDFLIGLCTAGVLDIDLQRRLGSQVATLKHARLDQCPGCMAYGSNGFLLIEESPDKTNCLGAAAQLVGTDSPSGHNKSVEIVGFDLGKRLVDSIAAAFVKIAIDCASLARLETDHGHFATSILDSFLGLREFWFFRPAGCDQNGN